MVLAVGYAAQAIEVLIVTTVPTTKTVAAVVAKAAESSSSLLVSDPYIAVARLNAIFVLAPPCACPLGRASRASQALSELVRADDGVHLA